VKRRRLNGEGTVYEEHDPRRKTTHRAQIEVRLPSGQVKRVVARGMNATDALRKARLKARRAETVPIEADRLKLGEYLDTWLDHKERQVRASTLATYRNDVRHVKQHLGRKPIGKVRAYDVQEMLMSLQRGDRGRSKADKVRRTLKQAMRQAVRWELLTRSPLENLEPLTKPEVKRGVWTPDEARRFLEAVRTSQRPVHYGFFVLALFTGARVGELMALTWDDVLEDRILIRRTWTRHTQSRVQPPKTKAGERSIPISPFVLEALGRRGDRHELVFPGPPLPENLRRALRYHAKRAGIEPIRLHDLRRTYATTLARLGHHPRVIQKLLGHSTPTLAMTVYTDVLAEQEDAARLSPEDVLRGATNGADATTTGPVRVQHGRAVSTPSSTDGDGGKGV
jgi:integrase